MAVYTGKTVVGLSRIDSSDDDSTAGCGDGTQSIVDFTAVKGQTYRIAVDGAGGELGSIGLFLDELTPPVAKPTSPPTATPAAFGAKTLVTLKLGAARIPAKGPLRVVVADGNAFTISGKLEGRTTKKVRSRASGGSG